MDNRRWNGGKGQILRVQTQGNGLLNVLRVGKTIKYQRVNIHSPLKQSSILDSELKGSYGTTSGNILGSHSVLSPFSQFRVIMEQT
jgi:hypothetical protein